MEMGDRGTGDGAVGCATVTRRLWSPPGRLLISILPLTLLALSGCRFAGDVIGAAAGGATGAATANPAVGIAVGVAVNSGIDATFAYITKKRQQAEQDAIAGVVATMQVGERRAWEIRHDIPIGNEHGEVEVTRAIVTPLTSCKEVAFSVDSGHGDTLKQAWYVTQTCQQGDRWKWALAEPAVERWGALQ